MSRSYEQMTLTERAEAHILSARQLLGGANQHYQQSGNQIQGPDGQKVNLAAAQALFTGAQAEALLAQACAALAANQGGRVVEISNRIAPDAGNQVRRAFSE